MLYFYGGRDDVLNRSKNSVLKFALNYSNVVTGFFIS